MTTLAERAKKSRKETGLSQKEAAKKIGITQPSLSAIETGKTKTISGSTLTGMARVYNISADWLETGNNIFFVRENHQDYNIKHHQLNENEVPLISLVQAGDWSEAFDPYPVGEGSESLKCPYPHGDSTFAVQITGQSMSPEFPEGMIIFIDPGRMPENKEYCVAKLEDTNEATFKQYVVEDGQKFLKATNPDWPKKYIQINGNCCIIGRLIGVYVKY